ncbi:hypothetical protein BU15DRAFT_47854 [Melanogaster broomeanus]|nr:hypothetical protein BU15DRAFT_47854 [Melanogaster broomeanus]
MWPSDITFIALDFFQIALLDPLASLALKSNAVVGHSVGETAVLYALALFLAAAWSNHLMAVKLAIARGKVLAMVDNTGGAKVVVLGSGADRVRKPCEERESSRWARRRLSRLFLTSFNGPKDMGVTRC